MTYEFGDYKVKTKRNSFLSFYPVEASVYYKNYFIETTGRSTETQLLRWAKTVIDEHKRTLAAFNV